MNASQLVAALKPCEGWVLAIRGGRLGQMVTGCREVMRLQPWQRANGEAGNVLLYNGFNCMSNGGAPCGVSLQAGDVAAVRWIRHEGQVVGLIEGKDGRTATVLRLGGLAEESSQAS